MGRADCGAVYPALRRGGSYHAGSAGDEERAIAGMTPQEIFELIVRADDAVKYAGSGPAAGPRIARARELLERALAEARTAGNGPLAAQAETRLADLEALDGGRWPGPAPRRASGAEDS